MQKLLPWGTPVMMGMALLLAVWARWPASPSPYLWLDEAWRAYGVSVTAGPRAFIEYMQQHGEVLLFSEWVFAKISWWSFGDAPFGFRVWPFIFSLLAILGAWSFLRRAGQPAMAPVAALVFALAYSFIYYHREFKPYAMDLAVTMWTLAAAVETTQTRKTGRLIIVLTCAALGSLVFVFIYPAVLAFLLYRRCKLEIRQYAMVLMPPLCFVLMYFFFLRPQNPGGTTAFWQGFYLTGWNDLQFLWQEFPQYMDDHSFKLWWLVAGLFFIALPVLSIRNRDGLWILFGTMFAMAVVVAMAEVYPLLARPSHYLYGVVILGAAWSLGQLIDLCCRRFSPYASCVKYALFLALLGVIGGWHELKHASFYARTWPTDTGRVAMTTLAREFKHDDALYINSPVYYTYLFHRQGLFPDGHPLRDVVIPRSDILHDADTDALRAELRRLVIDEPAGRRVWFYSGWFPHTHETYQAVLPELGAVEIHHASLYQTLVSVRLDRSVREWTGGARFAQ